MTTPDVKHCPICNLDLPIDEFGFCRARKDGRNLYCKSCIRIKVTAARRALKEYKANQKRLLKDRYWQQLNAPKTVEPITPLRKLSPAERVREAIRSGARTQSEIQSETKLPKDEIGDALASLLLWTHEIKTKVIDGTRMYFMNDVEQPKPIFKPAPSLFELARKGLGPAVQGDKKVKRVA